MSHGNNIKASCHSQGYINPVVTIFVHWYQTLKHLLHYFEIRFIPCLGIDFFILLFFFFFNAIQGKILL